LKEFSVSKQHIELSIPKRSLWSAGGLVVWVLVAWSLLRGYILPAMAPKLRPETATIADLWLAGVPIVCYVAVAVGVSLGVSVLKPLKPIDEPGLLDNLVHGLVGGLTFGLIAGLIAGFIAGFAIELVGGFIAGLVIGLAFGLVVGLVGGIIGGLGDELR